MRFIHLTDTHIVPGDATLHGSSPKQRLTEGMALINEAYSDVDFILITGDLAHHGETGAYETLRDVLLSAPMPVHLMLGNHDSRAPFRAVFPDAAEIAGGFVQFSIEGDSARVLCLDSLVDVPGDHAGRLCETRRDWLDREIAATPSDCSLIIACHHPPFDLGIPGMDEIKLTDGDALLEVFSRRRPDHMVFGHIHRPVSGTWKGIPFHIQRGFNHQVLLNFDRNAPLRYVEEPADISLVQVVEDSIQVFTRSIGGEGKPMDVDA